MQKVFFSEVVLNIELFLDKHISGHTDWHLLNVIDLHTMGGNNNAAFFLFFFFFAAICNEICGCLFHVESVQRGP
jgi:hypothetical protein